MTIFSLLVSRIAAVQQILAAQEETPALHVDKRAAPSKSNKKKNPSYDTDGIELPRPR